MNPSNAQSPHLRCSSYVRWIKMPSLSRTRSASSRFSGRVIAVILICIPQAFMRFLLLQKQLRDLAFAWSLVFVELEVAV